MEKVKRDRSAIFSLHERDILVSLIIKHQSVLENKQSDASSWKMKEAAWESIKKEFNARSGGVYRETKTLKIKYDGLKRTVRKKSAVIRSELYRTGGGQNAAPTLDNVEEQIKSLITLSTDGMQGIYDSDVIKIQENEGSIDDTFIMNVDIPKVVECESTQNEVLLLVTDECEPLPATSSTVPIEKNAIENINGKESEMRLLGVMLDVAADCTISVECKILSTIKLSSQDNSLRQNLSASCRRRKDSGEKARTILWEPLLDSSGRPKVLFAGEATNQTHLSTMYGASETGYREAIRKINAL